MLMHCISSAEGTSSEFSLFDAISNEMVEVKNLKLTNLKSIKLHQVKVKRKDSRFGLKLSAIISVMGGNTPNVEIATNTKCYTFINGMPNGRVICMPGCV